jgi:hypothetical protein
MADHLPVLVERRVHTRLGRDVSKGHISEPWPVKPSSNRRVYPPTDRPLCRGLGNTRPLCVGLGRVCAVTCIPCACGRHCRLVYTGGFGISHKHALHTWSAHAPQGCRCASARRRTCGCTGANRLKTNARRLPARFVVPEVSGGSFGRKFREWTLKVRDCSAARNKRYTGWPASTARAAVAAANVPTNSTDTAETILNE